jgi:hypothetical protein
MVFAQPVLLIVMYVMLLVLDNVTKQDVLMVLDLLTLDLDRAREAKFVLSAILGA